MNIIRKIREYFFQTTTDGSRFRTNDEPREATFRDLFNSMPFIAERIDRAKVYGSTQYPQGLVVKNTDQQAKTRINPLDVDSAGSPYAYSIDAENLPDIKSVDTVPDSNFNGINLSGNVVDTYTQFTNNLPLEVIEDNTSTVRHSTWKLKFHVNFIRFLLGYLTKLVDKANKMVLPKGLPNSMPTNVGSINYNTFRNTVHVKTEVGTDGNTYIQLSEGLIETIANRIVPIPEPTRLSYADANGRIDNASYTTHNITPSIDYNANALRCTNSVPYILKNVKHIGIGHEYMSPDEVNNSNIIVTSVHGDFTDIGRNSTVTEVGSESLYTHVGVSSPTSTTPQFTMPADVATPCAFLNGIKDHICVNPLNNCNSGNPVYMTNRLSIGEMAINGKFYMVMRVTDYQGNEVFNFRTELERTDSTFINVI